jgi:hypothetical protein
MARDEGEEYGREMGEDDPRWIPDDLLKSVQMERTIGPRAIDEGLENDETLSKRIFRENAPLAAAAIAKLAMHGSSERTRLDASKYIIERVLGPASADNGAVDPLTAFLEATAKKAEAFANGES